LWEVFILGYYKEIMDKVNLTSIVLLIAALILVGMYYNEFREKFRAAPSPAFTMDVGRGQDTTLTNELIAVSGTFSEQVDGPQFVANIPPEQVTGWKSKTPLIAQADPGKPGASFGRTMWSHFPWSDGHTYIRPGDRGKNINIDHAKHVRLGGTANDLCGANACSHFPWVNGHSYIRPGNNNHNIYIGDHATKHVRIGAPGNTTLLDSHWVKARRHIDAELGWGPAGTALFTGWVTDKTVVGNHKSGAHDYALNSPKNTVVVTNPLRVQKEVCIGNTCINEGHLKALKGDIPITIRAGRSGNRLMDHPNSVGYFSNKNRAAWERLYIEPCTSANDRFPGQTTTCP